MLKKTLKQSDVEEVQLKLQDTIVLFDKSGSKIYTKVKPLKIGPLFVKKSVTANIEEIQLKLQGTILQISG